MATHGSEMLSRMVIVFLALCALGIGSPAAESAFIVALSFVAVAVAAMQLMGRRLSTCRASGPIRP